ncbi:MAG TPA: hypothetical protein IAA84_12660 [Candidatus Alectryocaccomicrobium excrementavium]|uniref:Uncharacterized protein n=1 Tax=Candidatus Alectryocaccomicrobium excrementavium TaxID=2840668 RepID=A0A9D1G2F5_9FIRM|nr:hypothetical protein [Candidatus Alectryocaccomicrobium excrementavium]
MKMLFKAFARALFGARYERLARVLLAEGIAFAALRSMDLRLPVSPRILCLSASLLSAACLWQGLSAHGGRAESLQNPFMLPFENRAFVFAYAAAMGAHTFFTKTAALLALLMAIGDWRPMEICAGVLCPLHTILWTAAAFARKEWRLPGACWAAAICLCGGTAWIFPGIAAGSVLALFLLRRADGYAFCPQQAAQARAIPAHSHCLWRYFLRYFRAHKNYGANTVLLWGVACALPALLRQMEPSFAVPFGFACLALNTPVGVLLSGDRALEQAIRFLPGQKRAFCLPYCLFIGACNTAANAFFLGSQWLQAGSLPPFTGMAAVFFALQSAIFSVLLEWRWPLRGWKVESDLWHHPRKYLVPALMLPLAALTGGMPALTPALLALLPLEGALLLLWRGRA